MTKRRPDPTRSAATTAPRRRPPRRPAVGRALLPALALALAAMAGCDGVKHVLTSIVPAGVRTTDAQPRRFPGDLERGPDYDIQVVRINRKQIRFDNRTALAYESINVWINEQYGETFESIPIGPGPAVDLTRFINQHGESFAVGSLLAPEKAEAITTVAVEHAGQLHLLSVRLTDDWKRR